MQEMKQYENCRYPTGGKTLSANRAVSTARLTSWKKTDMINLLMHRPTNLMDGALINFGSRFYLVGEHTQKKVSTSAGVCDFPYKCLCVDCAHIETIFHPKGAALSHGIFCQAAVQSSSSLQSCRRLPGGGNHQGDYMC